MEEEVLRIIIEVAIAESIASILNSISEPSLSTIADELNSGIHCYALLVMAAAADLCDGGGGAERKKKEGIWGSSEGR